MNDEFYLAAYTKHCRDELTLYEKYIEQAERRLAARGGGSMDENHVRHIMEKTRQQLERYRAKRLSLLCEVEGEIDKEKFRAFVEENTRVTEAQHAQANAFKAKRRTAVTDRKEKLQKEKSLLNLGGKYDRSYRGSDGPSDKDILRSLNYLDRTWGFVPNYMRENLSRMPCNRGYLWRQIFLLGELPPEGDPTGYVFFEKDREVLFTHEWTRDRYLLHKKKTRTSPREEVLSLPRPVV